jgi:hypothetical protein
MLNKNMKSLVGVANLAKIYACENLVVRINYKPSNQLDDFILTHPKHPIASLDVRVAPHIRENEFNQVRMNLSNISKLMKDRHISITIRLATSHRHTHTFTLPNNPSNLTIQSKRTLVEDIWPENLQTLHLIGGNT